MMVMVSSMSVTGPGRDQLNVRHRTWSWWSWSVQRPSQDLVMVVKVSSTSIIERGHGGHGQFNVRHRTWSW